MSGEVGLPRDSAPDAIEGAFGAQVNSAGGGVGVDVGADGFIYLDRLHAIEGGHFHREGTSCA